MWAMEDAYRAAGSVPAMTSAFYQAELQAFAAMAKMSRPDSWATVERLQQVCRDFSPATIACAATANDQLAAFR